MSPTNFLKAANKFGHNLLGCSKPKISLRYSLKNLMDGNGKYQRYAESHLEPQFVLQHRPELEENNFKLLKLLVPWHCMGSELHFMQTSIILLKFEKKYRPFKFKKSRQNGSLI